MLKTEKLEQKLKDGQVLIGTHAHIAESVITHIIALQGFDILWIDTEHSAIDRRDLNHMLMAVAPTDTAAFVRVTWNDPQIVKPILEMGPDGIVFPNIRTKEEAELAVASVLYPPDGIRGYGPQRANMYGMIDNDEYLEHVAKKVWKIMQIEDWRTVERLEEILAVPGIDAIQIGPKDFSASMGKLKAFDQEVWDMLQKLVEKCNKANVPIGTSFAYSGSTSPLIEKWISMGVNWINVNSDVTFLMEGAKTTLHNVQQSLKKHKNRKQ